MCFCFVLFAWCLCCFVEGAALCCSLLFHSRENWSGHSKTLLNEWWAHECVLNELWPSAGALLPDVLFLPYSVPPALPRILHTVCTWAVHMPGLSQHKVWAGLQRPQAAQFVITSSTVASSSKCSWAQWKCSSVTWLSGSVHPLSGTFTLTAISESRQVGKAKGIEPCKELISKIKSLKILR